MRGEALGKKMIIFMANDMKTTIVAISEWADLADSRVTVTVRRIVFTGAMYSLIVLDMETVKKTVGQKGTWRKDFILKKLITFTLLIVSRPDNQRYWLPQQHQSKY